MIVTIHVSLFLIYLERFTIDMGIHMSRSEGSRFEPFTTNCALKGPFSIVYSRMYF